MKISIIHIGNVALQKDGSIYSLKSYTSFLNELVDILHRVRLFSGVSKEGDVGFEFSNEEKLSDRIVSIHSRGNTPNTPLVPFLRNNINLFINLLKFCSAKDNYFIFLPSPIGVLSLLLVIFLKRKEKLGIYVGGYYGLEQKYEQRSGNIKKIIKRILAKYIDSLVEYAIKKADYVVTSSYEYYERYKSQRNVILTPPLINVDESDLVYSKLENDTSRFITYCGELRHAKGCVDLLKAFILLVKNHRINDCKLKIIGSGQAEAELRNLVFNNKIEDLVVFCGQIKDKTILKDEINNSTIFVLPSYSEGFPRVAYECFTLGVPTILTPVGGIPYFVKNNEHCLFCTPGDINSIANQIERLMEDNCLRVQISKNARQLMMRSIFPRIREYKSLAQVIVKSINGLELFQ